MHWLSHALGIDNLSGPIYGLWSGAGSDVSELALLGAVVEMFRRHSCHVYRCWRPGHHPVEVDGVTYKVCRRHHPCAPSRVTSEHIAGGVGA